MDTVFDTSTPLETRGFPQLPAEKKGEEGLETTNNSSIPFPNVEENPWPANVTWYS
jgi:hypothetical protein